MKLLISDSAHKKSRRIKRRIKSLGVTIQCLIKSLRNTIQYVPLHCAVRIKSHGITIQCIAKHALQTAYFKKQCAAVTTHWNEMMAPPQVCIVAKRRDTCHGQEWGKASEPPMMRASVSSSEGNARTPVTATPGGNFLLVLHGRRETIQPESCEQIKWAKVRSYHYIGLFQSIHKLFVTFRFPL